MKTFNGALAMLLSTCILAAPTNGHADVKPPDETSAGLAQIAEPRYRALELAVRNDPKMSEAMAKMKVSAKEILTDRALKPKERDQKLSDLSRRFEPTLKQLFRQAGIDELKYVEEGERHIKRMAQRKGVKYHAKYLGYLGWYWKFLPKPKPAPKPADKVITLSAPFPLEQSQRNGSGGTTVDKENGTYKVSANVAFVGAHDNVAGLAHFFEVDDNYRSVEVSIALPETEWFVGGFADIFAVFGSHARSKVEIFNNNRVVCTQEVQHADFFAPVVYMALRSGVDNVVVDCEIPAPAQGDEIVVRTTSVAGAWGGVIGSASASVNAQPRDLRLLLKY